MGEVRVKNYSAPARQIHIDVPLSNLSVAFVPSNFIADDIYPVVPVGKRSDKYFIFDKGAWFRVPNTRRAPNTAPRKVEFSVSSDSYFSDNFALEEDIPWEDLTNADPGIDPRQTTAEHLTSLLKLDKEKRIANQVRSTSNVGCSTTLTGTDQWSDFANSDPFTNISDGQDAVHGTTGKDVNVMAMGRPVWQKLKNHPDILDRLKITDTKMVTKDLMARLFEVEKLLVGGAIENTAEEGQADSFSSVWGGDVFMAHVTPTPGMRQATFGYAFQWKPSNFPVPFAVSTIMDEHMRKDILSVEYYQDEKIVSAELGYLIKAAV